MILSELRINNFRNIKKLSFNFDSLISYIYAPNGSGKTNVLEAIQCISLGKTLRSSSEAELLDYHGQVSPLIAKGKFHDEALEFTHRYSIQLNPKKKKVLYINKSKAKITEILGRAPTIWFSPESIKIISSSPLNKRKYFDDILIQLYPNYIFNLKNYNKALLSRNKLLQQETLNPNQIGLWTEQLIKFGANIIKTRQKFFKTLNTDFELLNNDKYSFRIESSPSINLHPIFEEDASFRFREELQKHYKEDRFRRLTTVGPHRDDWNILIKINSHDNSNFIRADKFASRGQQRMALITLQMVLVNIFTKSLNTTPILLLDDIFSELDKENEEILLNSIKENNIQTFITGVEEKKYKQIKEYNLLKYL